MVTAMFREDLLRIAAKIEEAIRPVKTALKVHWELTEEANASVAGFERVLDSLIEVHTAMEQGRFEDATPAIPDWLAKYNELRKLRK